MWGPRSGYSSALRASGRCLSRLGRADFQVDAQHLRQGLFLHGYEELAITGAHALAVCEFPALHEDPFDGILLAPSPV